MLWIFADPTSISIIAGSKSFQFNLSMPVIGVEMIQPELCTISWMIMYPSISTVLPSGLASGSRYSSQLPCRRQRLGLMMVYVIAKSETLDQCDCWNWLSPIMNPQSLLFENSIAKFWNVSPVYWIQPYSFRAPNRSGCMGCGCSESCPPWTADNCSINGGKAFHIPTQSRPTIDHWKIEREQTWNRLLPINPFGVKGCTVW